MAATSYLVFATTSLLTLSLAQITVLLTQASDAVVVATDFFDSNSTGVFTFMSTTTTPTAITPNSASTTPGFIGGIATLTSATTTTSPSQSTSDSTARANLAAASSGLASSVKVGIGLGVPLGLIILSIVGFLIFQHQKHRKGLRLRYHGKIAANGLNAAVDERCEATEDGGERVNLAEKDEPQVIEEEGVHEIHGLEVPAYSRELAGSPGVRRQELPTRRGSV